MAGWGNRRYFDLTNGTLTATEGFRLRYTYMRLWDGAKLVVPATANGKANVLQLNDNHGMVTTLMIDPNAELDAPCTLNFDGPNEITVSAGAVATLGSVFKQKNYGNYARTSKIENEGTLNLPGELVWDNDAEYQTTELNQKGGTLRLGGPLTRNGRLGTFKFAFGGGAVEVTGGSVTFSGLDSATVADGVEMPVSVAEGAGVSLSGVTLGAGASVVKSGLGALLIDAQPGFAVSVTDGPARIVANNLENPLLALADGVQLVFAAGGTRLDALENVDNLTLTIDTAVMLPGQTVVRCSDETLRATLKSKLSAGLASNFRLREMDDTLVLSAVEPNTFDATVSSDLSNAEAWGGTVPAAGQDVIIAGGLGATYDSVDFTSAAPRFKSITLRESAELRVTGGTEETPLDLPEIREQLHARLVVTEGSYVTLTNGLNNVAEADAVPEFEIETNATVRVPGGLGGGEHYDQYAYAFVPDTMCFRNVDLRLYGTIRLPDVLNGGRDWTKPENQRPENFGYSRLVFGWAAKGETTYFAMTADGGKVRVDDASCQYEGNHSRIDFVSPEAGGTVRVIRDIVLRDFDKDVGTRRSSANSGYWIGANNPPEETFNFIAEGTSEFRAIGPTFFGGGAKVLLRNGAKWSPRTDEIEYTHTHGHAMAYSAQMTLDGPDVIFCHPFFNLNNSIGDPAKPWAYLWRGVSVFSTPSADEPLFTLRNGATMSVWTFFGKAGTFAQVEGGYWNVDKPCGINNNSTFTYYENSSVFSGMDRVNVAAGTTLAMRATDDYPDRKLYGNVTNYYPNWQYESDRYVALEIPVTGLGGIEVVNALPETLNQWTMTLVVTNGANTATGPASVRPNETGAKAFLKFADGANWAGKVVADGNVSLTNLVDAAAPATANFQSLELTGDFPIRVWKTDDTIANDRVNVATAATGRGRFVLEPVEGTVENGDKVVLGRYPANAELPRVKGCTVATEPIDGDSDYVTLTATRGVGSMLFLR